MDKGTCNSNTMGGTISSVTIGHIILIRTRMYTMNYHFIVLCDKRATSFEGKATKLWNKLVVDQMSNFPITCV